MQKTKSKQAKLHKVAVPTSLDREHIDFVERSGAGNNFSAKLRNILDRARESMECLATYSDGNFEIVVPEALCIYHCADGERVWMTDLPFDYDRKGGWKGLPSVARGAGFICQVIEEEETGMVAVWVALPKSKRDCKACAERILKAIRG